MAVEHKFAKSIYSTVARFAVQFKCFGNCPQSHTYQIKSFAKNPFHSERCYSTLKTSSILYRQSDLSSRLNEKFNLVQASSKCFIKYPINIIQPERCFSTFQTSTIFRQLNPPSRLNKNSSLLQGSSNTLVYLKGLPKSFFRQRKSDDDKKKPNSRRIPKLILVQNPFKWLMIKIDFKVLRRLWDPTFEEKEFKFGTKQAISKVTHVISDGEYSNLNGLLTKAARLSLMRELDRNWSDKQRSLLALNREDIQISSPRKVYFIRIADKKYCDIDMAFLALKWAPINSIDALIFTEIFARFHREYTPHSIPEWTIAYFKVTRFEVLRRKAKTESKA